VHIGTFPFHTGGATRIRVVARLGMPPLTTRRLVFHGAASRAYLSAVSAQQTRAARQIRAAIPQARIGRRFQIVLNALTVSLPASQLPMLVRQPSVTKVYPSVTYTLALDRSPSIIGADVLRSASNADGSGIKIAGRRRHRPVEPVLRSGGLLVPAGFPRGSRKWTTPKVIVAGSSGAERGEPGRLAVDPESRFTARTSPGSQRASPGRPRLRAPTTRGSPA
jgi:hypothetical protein